MGSLIRKNCLEVGDTQYIFDRTVTDSTIGIYYTFNNDTKQFEEVNLDGSNFDSTIKYYYKSEALTQDGSFIGSIKNFIDPKPVLNRTWSGYGGAVNSSTIAKADTTIIETIEKVWLPSDSQIFGDNHRSKEYSKYQYEGNTFEAFKEYFEDMFAGSDRWLRSPYLSNSYCFCYWYSNGYVNSNHASHTNSAPLCFSI